MALSKKLRSSDAMQIKQLREGTKEKSFSWEVIYQKLNRFTGWKCHLRYFHIKVDGEIHENCFNDRRNILNDDLNTGIKICPFNKCVHDCMLETLKTKN